MFKETADLGWDMQHWYATSLSSRHLSNADLPNPTGSCCKPHIILMILASRPDRRARVPWPPQPWLRILASEKVDPSPISLYSAYIISLNLTAASPNHPNVIHCCCFMPTLIEAENNRLHYKKGWSMCMPSRMFSDSRDFPMSNSM